MKYVWGPCSPGRPPRPSPAVSPVPSREKPCPRPRPRAYVLRTPGPNSPARRESPRPRARRPRTGLAHPSPPFIGRLPVVGRPRARRRPAGRAGDFTRIWQSADGLGCEGRARVRPDTSRRLSSGNPLTRRPRVPRQQPESAAPTLSDGLPEMCGGGAPCVGFGRPARPFPTGPPRAGGSFPAQPRPRPAPGIPFMSADHSPGPNPAPDRARAAIAPALLRARISRRRATLRRIAADVVKWEKDQRQKAGDPSPPSD
jgi:hypothetical protein